MSALACGEYDLKQAVMENVGTVPSTLHRLYLVSVSAVLASCAPQPVVIDVSEAEIEQRISPRFPVKTTKLLTDVVLSSPDVILAEGSDRVGLKLDVLVKPPLLGPFTGKLAVSGTLSYRYDEKAFYLQDPHVDDLKVDGVSEDLLAKTRQPIESVALHYLSEHPVYEFKSRNIKEITAQYVLQSVRVANGSLQAVIAPPL